MISKCEIKSFKNEEDAQNCLKNSRIRIDEIDSELFNLICQRTSLAGDIALAKDYLDMPIYDKGREDSIHDKIQKLSDENGLDADIMDRIVNMLTMLSKNEQKEIFRRNVNG